MNLKKSLRSELLQDRSFVNDVSLRLSSNTNYSTKEKMTSADSNLAARQAVFSKLLVRKLVENLS